MAYWVLANWLLYDLRQGREFFEQARAGSEAIVRLQTRDGSWPYPLRERRHLKATIEGNWASLALLESYRRIHDEPHRRAALHWQDFLLSEIGFQSYRGTLAVNYFDQPRGNIPNNSTNTLWLLAELSELVPPSETGAAGRGTKAPPSGSPQEHPAPERSGADLDEKIKGLLAFLHTAQRPSGEFPYILANPFEQEKIHYLCYQYNAFEFLDLFHFTRIRPGQGAETLLGPLTGFLETGMDPEGFARASCLSPNPRVLYYTAAVATALWKAHTIHLLPAADRSLRSLERLLDYQRSDGSFPFSERDYGFLRDERSYPRYQAMILYFLCTVAMDLLGREP
jgi:hypothetical protein